MTTEPFTGERFAYWWTLFVERWRSSNRPPAELATEYARAFRRANLSAAELDAAAALALERDDFLPSPASIMARVRPQVSARLAAADAWSRVTTIAAQYGGDAHSKREQIAAELGPSALAAYKIIGDLGRIRRATDDDWQWIRKEFMQAFADAIECAQQDDDVARLLSSGSGHRGQAHIGAVVQGLLTGGTP